MPYYNTPDFNAQFLTNKEAQKNITHTIDNFEMIDQNNQKITQKDIEGKIHIANFIFTSCGSICPKMTANLVEAEKKLKEKKDVVFLSFSVTPWMDSVARLKKFAEQYNIINPNWHLLTGDKATIYSLARKSYFAEEDLGFTKDSTEFLHTEHILLIDKQKRIRGIYNGTLPLDTEQMVKDIETLQNESKN